MNNKITFINRAIGFTLFIILFFIIGCEEPDQIRFLKTDDLAFELQANGGNAVIQIYSNDDWQILNDCEWLSFSAAQGIGNQTITYNWDENSMNERREAIVQVVSKSAEKLMLNFNQMASPIRLIYVADYLGNNAQNEKSFISILFDRPIQLEEVKYHYTYCLPTLEFEYFNNNKGIKLYYPCAELGGTFPMDINVFDEHGNRLITTFTINFFDTKKEIDGHITSFYYEEKSKFYWITTREPNRIYKVSVPTLEINKIFELDFLPGKLCFNEYNKKFYVLSNFPEQSYFDKFIYIMDTSTGSVIKKFQMTPHPDDHPEHPSILPFDIAFQNNGIGVVLLRANDISGSKWKLIDSSNDDEMHILSRPIIEPPIQPTMVYKSFEENSIIMASETTHIINNLNTHTLELEEINPLESSFAVRFLIPNRLNNSFFVTSGWHHFVTDHYGNVSNVLFERLFGSTADFSYKSNDNNYIYYLVYSDFMLIDFNDLRLISRYRAKEVLRGLTSTTDGKYIIMYNNEPVFNDLKYTSNIYQFTTDIIVH